MNNDNINNPDRLTMNIAMLIGYYINHQDNNYRFKSMHIVTHK